MTQEMSGTRVKDQISKQKIPYCHYQQGYQELFLRNKGRDQTWKQKIILAPQLLDIMIQKLCVELGQKPVCIFLIISQISNSQKIFCRHQQNNFCVSLDF
jgi:hypothetical protein